MQKYANAPSSICNITETMPVVKFPTITHTTNIEIAETTYFSVSFKNPATSNSSLIIISCINITSACVIIDASAAPIEPINIISM